MTDLFSAPPPTTTGPAPVPSRTAQRRRQKASAAARRRRRRRRIVVLFLALVVVGGAGWYVYEHVLPGLSFGSFSAKAADYEGQGTGPVQVTVNPGDTGTAIGRTLLDAGVVKSVKAFTEAYGANPNAAGIQPGVYTLRKEMKASEAVAMLAANTGRVEYQVTVPEGYTVEQIVSRASGVTGIPASEFAKAKKNTKATGLPAAAKGNYEGWLYPATYSFDPDVDATDILSQMIAKTKAELKTLKVPSSQQEEVLIKASIVEREVSRDKDRPKVARAIQNRLDNPDGPNAGRLETDSTTAYGLGTPTVPPTQAQNHDPKNPYSTYEHAGLPPGPIANPGQASIKAVLNPAPGPWIYWMTVDLDTGETKFGTTWQDHTDMLAELHVWQTAHAKDK
ncbi:ABC transporter substrate-binding protein [Luteimicrobium album]|uniref:Endolytic murein transglycosylase n=1 Tax=Luteimicrobium album TaxID=1054550 RepID=A0ABQ6I570_9MICO|nr:endolytic transglycosylase MltG [Luteimicrobium album]GMA25900.1 ABC transporter substrate-binding protein [Luteimicrobium album]